MEEFPQYFHFIGSDIKTARTRIRHTNLVSFSQAMALYLGATEQSVLEAAQSPAKLKRSVILGESKSDLNNRDRERLRQLRLASVAFGDAIASAPSSFYTLLRWGCTLHEQARIVASMRERGDTKIDTKLFQAMLLAAPSASAHTVTSDENLVDSLLQSACERFHEAITINKESSEGFLLVSFRHTRCFADRPHRSPMHTSTVQSSAQDVS
jgi:hypothetical protein